MGEVSLTNRAGAAGTRELGSSGGQGPLRYQGRCPARVHPGPGRPYINRDYLLLWNYLAIIEEVNYLRAPYSSLEMVRGDYRIIWKII